MPDPIVLPSITNLQRRNNVRLFAQDDNNHKVPSFNGLSLINNSPPGVVSFENLRASPDSDPLGSEYLVDIISGSVGTATFTARGQQGNGEPVFDTFFTIDVTQDPSLPGKPTHWGYLPGTVVAK